MKYTSSLVKSTQPELYIMRRKDIAMTACSLFTKKKSIAFTSLL